MPKPTFVQLEGLLDAVFRNRSAKVAQLEKRISERRNNLRTLGRPIDAWKDEIGEFRFRDSYELWQDGHRARVNTELAHLLADCEEMRSQQRRAFAKLRAFRELKARLEK